MPISDIPILAMLRERMQWHQARQQVLAENVANADTPNYQAKDLAPPDFQRELSVASLALVRTDAGHIVGAGGGGSQFATDESARYEVRPRGNSVTHEDEMLKVASNQMDFEAVTSLYTHSLALIKLAIGKA
ncbi:MAG TPA: flagellar basal body rod protein FlgB [Xanthobacteraceae bacterium]|nr:flagellar basal body rod protein FlgB [Xanthobacteraceae bacterium]